LETVHRNPYFGSIAYVIYLGEAVGFKRIFAWFSSMLRWRGGVNFPAVREDTLLKDK